MRNGFTGSTLFCPGHLLIALNLSTNHARLSTERWAVGNPIPFPSLTHDDPFFKSILPLTPIPNHHRLSSLRRPGLLHAVPYPDSIYSSGLSVYQSTVRVTLLCPTLCLSGNLPNLCDLEDPAWLNPFDLAMPSPALDSRHLPFLQHIRPRNLPHSPCFPPRSHHHALKLNGR
jgi:hypothetical protein